MRALEGADLARHAVIARLAAEQLDLQPVGMHRRAIDRDKRSRRASRAGMQQAPDHFLAGARRPGDEDPAAGRRDPLDLLAQLVDRRRGADQIEFAAGPQPQLGILAAQLGRLDRARDQEQQAIALERLFDEIVGAELDRLHRGLDRSVAADHHHRHGRHLGVQPAQDGNAVEFAALQPDVEDHQGRLAGMDGGEGLGAVGGVARRVALVLQHPGDQHPDVGFVVYDQDVMRHG